jgi:transposase
MAAWKLRPEEWEALDQVRFSTMDVSVFRNATIILMTAVGRSKQSIGADLGCCPATVDNIRQRYRQQGLAGLKRRKPLGRKSQATPEYRVLLRQTVLTQPQTLGYGFSVWSVARLEAHLRKQTGIGFSVDQMRRLLHAMGFSFQRPKHTLKGKRDEVAYALAQDELETLKKKPCATMSLRC